MASFCFLIVAAAIATYAVFDGLDLGAGAIYLIAAKTNDERRRVLRAIGPIWDGNEIWLLGIGGVLYLAFPRVYIACFRGFCGTLMIALWLFVLRAIVIALRPYATAVLWQSLLDSIISISSILLVVLFGVALGNIVRGVPLDSAGYFFQPLWTNFKLGPQTGFLDWYTSLTSILSLVTMAAHGSYYVAQKTGEDLGRRARGFALLCWPLQFFLTCISLVATYFIQPEIVANYQTHKLGILIPAVVFASLAAMLWANPKAKGSRAFIASSLYITSMLMSVAFGLYPVLLSARDPRNDLTIYNSRNGGLNIAPVWWIAGVVFAIIYLVFALGKFRRKVEI